MRVALGIAALLIITALSAFFDAKGFVYAAQAWRTGSFVPATAALSLANFIGGITLYVASIGFQQYLGVQSAALQTIFWFAMTIIGVALLDGTLGQWNLAQRAVGVGVTVGIGWLLISAPHAR
jgi:hypothetical protein